VAKFNDRLGRTWEFCMTVADLKPLAAVGIEFKGFDVKHETIPAALFSDPAKMMEVFAVLAHFDEAIMSPEDFARGFDTDATQRAIAAAIEALASFSQTSPVGQTKGRVAREAWEHQVREIGSKLSTVSVSNLQESPG